MPGYGLVKMSFSAQTVFDVFYPEDTPLRRLLYRHSCQVRDKALEILRQAGNAAPALDPRLVADGALLHDVGVGRCHAPGILCVGSEPYITHGLIGGALLREYGKSTGMDLEAYARICERHTGAGLTRKNIMDQKLPLPERDFLPETPEEKLICLADKFFSKSGDMQEKSLAAARHSLEKFGADTLERFDGFCTLFGIALP